MRGADRGTITVVSGDVVVGGVTKLDSGKWAWALFAVRQTDYIGRPDKSALVDSDSIAPASAGLSGREETKSAALDAIRERWRVWLADAHLCHRVGRNSFVSD